MCRASRKGEVEGANPSLPISFPSLLTAPRKAAVSFWCEMKVRCFDSHPGLMGCPTPIPETVRFEAEALSGEVLDLETAVERIREAAGGEYRVKAVNIGGSRSIQLTRGTMEDVEKGGSMDCWRVLRLAVVTDEPRHRRKNQPNQD
jgi:hypothetical protein